LDETIYATESQAARNLKMIEPKQYASAVLLAELWWQQFFNGNPAPLADALKPISELTPEFVELYRLVTRKGEYSDVKRQRIAANDSLGLGAQ
jgi:hypothetical protein